MLRYIREQDPLTPTRFSFISASKMVFHKDPN